GFPSASPMHMTSAVERNGPEPQPDNGPLLRPWPHPWEDRTPSPMAPQPPSLWGVQIQGPSVLQSKVRALKEKMAAGKQGASSCPTSHEQSSLKKPKCRQVKARGIQAPSEGSSLPEAMVGPHVQNPSNGPLDSSVDEEELSRNGDSRPPWSPALGLECWNGQSPCSPEAVWMLPDGERGLPPESGSLQESPTRGITPDCFGGPRPCKVTHMPRLKKGRPCALQDGLVTGGDLDSTSLTSEENFVPRAALLRGLWRPGGLEAVGTPGGVLSLSDRVERNRLLLQEMLKVSGQSPPKAETPAWTPSWDTAVPERSSGDVDWDSGISLQDSDQNRTFGPKPEPMLSARHEEAKHLLQHARMKARTQPLRANHDIVPAIAQGSRDGQSSPAPAPRMASACRDSLQNGSVSDSSRGESSSGQWPKQGTSPSHVRFEDETTCEAEFRYLERLQQRQRQVLSTVLQAAGQGPLRSKPHVTHYTNRDVGEVAFPRSMGGLDRRARLVPPAPWGSKGECRACGQCLQDGHPAEGKVPPGPGVPQGLQAARGVEEVVLQPQSSRGLSSPLHLFPAEPVPHSEWIQETHIGATTMCPEEGDSTLDSTDTSDGCRTDSEEAGTSQPSRTGGWPRGSSLQQRGSRPQGGHKQSKKAEMESSWGPEAPQGVDDVEEGDEVKEGRGCTPEGTLFLREDAVPKPPELEPERTSLGSQKQPGPELRSHWTHPVDSWAPSRTASSMKLGPSGPGRPDQVIESHKSPEIVCTSSLQQSHAEPSAQCPTQQPAASLFPEGWVPTPPSSRKTTSPVPRRKAALSGSCRKGNQGEPLSSSRTMVLETCGLSIPQAQSCSPQVRHPLLALSTNNCNNHISLGLQEPWRAAAHGGRAERSPCGQEPDLSLESSRDGGLQGSLTLADAVVNSVGITLSLASEELESGQELEGGLQRTESSSGGHVPPGASPGASAGPKAPPAAASEVNKKRSSGLASTLGLKKLLSVLGQTSRPKLGKSRSYSVEQLQPAAPSPASRSSASRVKRAPSLQSLPLVSPSHQRRKASSFQNLHSLLSGKGDRSSLYLVEGPEDSSARGRLAKAPPRRALSVEDVGAPSLPRTVGRVVEVFPDGTSQLQLQRSPEGTFGFCVTSGNGRRDSGLYVQEMADPDTAKLYSGLLGVGDEILEVNGAKVAGPGLAHVQELLAHSESLSLRVLRQRPVPR
uniref:KIAA1614 n=1 Tax=Sciurus vulgaris TaxID=55149 RepID=A0A8D2DCI5_SCIVU